MYPSSREVTNVHDLQSYNAASGRSARAHTEEQKGLPHHTTVLLSRTELRNIHRYAIEDIHHLKDVFRQQVDAGFCRRGVPQELAVRWETGP